MYIAHVISSLTTGGAEKLVADISKVLKQKGVKVKIISILKKRGVPYEIIKENNIELVELNYTNKFDIRIAYDIYKETKSCDIVHTHTFYAQFYSAILINKERLITTEHNTHNNRRNKKFFWVMDYLMYKKYTNIICISEATQLSLNTWIKETKEKTSVIYNGIDIDSYRNANAVDRKFFGIENDKIILTCVASLTKQKNHIKLINAMKNVNESISLFIIGDGVLRGELIKQVEELNLTSRIKFLGNKYNIPEILKGSDIFIIPSIWEGFGLVAVEAAAANLPLILSDVPGLNSLFLENEVYKVNENDEKNIAATINLVAENLSSDIRKVNDENIDKYSINNMVTKHICFYKKMLMK